MKALICDLCGAVVPDVPEADLIQNIVITKGGPKGDRVIERDMCLTCLEKLIMGIGQVYSVSDLASRVISALDSTQNNELVAPKAEIAQELIQSQLDRLEAMKAGDEHVPAPEPALEVICEQCGKPFQPLSGRSRLCGTKCANQEQRAKNRANPNATDALLKKLKSENPINETKRPNIYHEM